MAFHVRRQIRDAVHSLVSGGGTSLGANVFNSRIELYANSELPAGAVYTRRDETDPELVQISGVVERTLLLSIEVRAKAASGMENELDLADAEIQALIMADATIGALAFDTSHLATEIEFDNASEQKVGVATIDYRVLYRIDEKDATVAVTT